MLSILLSKAISADLNSRNITDISKIVHKIKEMQETLQNKQTNATNIQPMQQQMKRTAKALPPQCDGAVPHNFQFNTWGSLTLQAGEFVCVDFTGLTGWNDYYYGFVAFGEGLRFEGFDQSFNCRYTSEGSYASTYPITKVYATTTTSVQCFSLRFIGDIVITQEGVTLETKTVCKLILDSASSGTITDTYKISPSGDLIQTTRTYILYFNPNYGKVTVTPEHSLCEINNGVDPKVEVSETSSLTGKRFNFVATNVN